MHLSSLVSLQDCIYLASPLCKTDKTINIKTVRFPPLPVFALLFISCLCPCFSLQSVLCFSLCLFVYPGCWFVCYLFVCLCLSVYLFVCLCLSICLLACWFVCLSISLSLFVCLSSCLLVCLFVSVCLFVRFSRHQLEPAWSHSCSCPSVVCQSLDYKEPATHICCFVTEVEPITNIAPTLFISTTTLFLCFTTHFPTRKNRGKPSYFRIPRNPKHNAWRVLLNNG